MTLLRLSLQTFFNDPSHRSMLLLFWQQAFQKAAISNVEIQDDPANADVLLFVDGDWSNESRALRQHPLVKTRPNQCYILDESDLPLDFLPGLYAAIPRARFKPSRHRAFCYPYSQYVIRNQALREASPASTRDLLMSFVGRPTARVRKHILQHDWNRSDIEVEDSRDYNHWENNPLEQRARQEKYANTVIRSHFVLCPRGAGTGSIRLFETMEMGRCPVILSDDYILPSGVDWNLCSIVVPERDWQLLPDILEKRKSESIELGRRAREEWSRYFSPCTLPQTLVHLLREIAPLELSPSREALQALWQSSFVLEARSKRWLSRLRWHYLPALRKFIKPS